MSFVEKLVLNYSAGSAYLKLKKSVIKYVSIAAGRDPELVLMIKGAIFAGMKILIFTSTGVLPHIKER